MLAADGARSAIRRMRGLRLKGENYEGRYVIADVQMKHDYPTIRRALFDPACRPGGTVLVHKQPDDIWRIDYQLRDDESAEEATREENVRAAVAGSADRNRPCGRLGPRMVERLFRQHPACSTTIATGACFFVGDSAHIVPIFGVRGLNNGIADGHNIGWKLAGRPERRGRGGPDRQLHARATRRDARRLRQRDQEHALHDPADPRMAGDARRGAARSR